MQLRYQVSPDGRIEPRRLDHDTLKIALSQLIARDAAIAAQLPEPWRPGYALLSARSARLLERLQRALDALAPVEPTQPPSPPAALLALVDEETLTSPRLLNNLIDRAVGDVDETLERATRRLGASPETREDATLLRERLFHDGRAFLTLSNRRQWSAIDQRFARLDEASRARAERLDLADAVAQIVSLNDWFGHLIGVTAPTTDDPARAREQLTDHLDALTRDGQAHLVHLLAFANLAWPDDTPEHATLRAALVSPWLDPMLDTARKHSAAIHRARDERAVPPPAAE